MEPHLKAKKIFNKFYQIGNSIEWTTNEETKQKAGEYNEELGPEVEKFWHEHAKRCALIAVDEIIKSKQLNYLFTKEQIYCMEGTSDDRWIYETFHKYWKKVKQELKNMKYKNCKYGK